jgi:UDP-N-acetylglucosamine diphosphorylase / glucose-1-phosphate thymidylyltransferase / UDP-N-acetylgalactosamine diphosphorylase / glucosamine-1-phosphate N-acetyltransferase / galactosamine-1-phosphate N-acetyltransferase
MNIVVPMAGLGSRFSQAGYTTPKPLIPVLGKPMYAWAVDSLPLAAATQLIFILLRSQPEYPVLKRDLEERYAARHPLVLDVPELTAGQAVTVLRAKEIIDNETPLLIHNADTAFEVDQRWVREAMDSHTDGALLVFRSDEKRWSYSREDETGRVVEVREKQVISPWASTGTYWFRHGTDFVRLAENRYRGHRSESGEFYVAPLYNDLAAEGKSIRNFPIERLFCLGTPEDLERTLPLLAARDR